MNIFTPTAAEIFPPDLEIYPVAMLALFPRLTRAKYRQHTGEQAPPWEPSRRIKRWADRTLGEADPDGAYPVRWYQVEAGEIAWKETTITNAEAAALNLPGQYDYPKWDPAPVGGFQASNYDGSRQQVDVDAVSTREQAEILSAELNGLGVEEHSLDGPFYFWFEPSEKRRIWWVKLSGGGKIFAGRLLKKQYVNGVGAPGRWIRSERVPWWKSGLDEIPEEWDARPEIPIPMRALEANERLQLGFGGAIQVVTAESDTDLLRRIDRNVREIRDLVEG
ncbi:hypothetical protein LCGC14_1744260 [marine sediment metagenome]|uniref:Uncharacterized protein n=1 Tax=marine sediment metagenome TaxID=412755 RepID=A0A0F9H5P8_9ZZZZ